MIFSVLGNAGRVASAKRKGRVGCSAQESKIYSGKNLLHKYLLGNIFFLIPEDLPHVTQNGAEVCLAVIDDRFF